MIYHLYIRLSCKWIPFVFRICFWQSQLILRTVDELLLVFGEDAAEVSTVFSAVFLCILPGVSVAEVSAWEKALIRMHHYYIIKINSLAAVDLWALMNNLEVKYQCFFFFFPALHFFMHKHLWTFLPVAVTMKLPPAVLTTFNVYNRGEEMTL